MKIDSGTVSGSTPAYYAKFQQVCTQYLHQTNTTVCKILQPYLDGPSQQAISPSGYWVLDMDQACYKGQHLTMWTPIGAVVSAIVCLGIPLLTALPIFINRSVQLGTWLIKLNPTYIHVLILGFLLSGRGWMKLKPDSAMVGCT